MTATTYTNLPANVQGAIDRAVSIKADGRSRRVNVLGVDLPEAADLMASLQSEGIGATAERPDSDWSGANPETTLRRARQGDAGLVAASDALVSEFEDKIDFPTSRAANVRAVAGGAVSVPAYLSGRPNCMLQRRQVVSDIAPITVMVDICVSASVDHSTIARRGAAMLALVRLLSTVRPVTLYALAGETVDHYGSDAGKYNGIIAVRLDTAPLDLARAAWLLGSTEATRRLGFGLGTMVAGYPADTAYNWLWNDADAHKKHIYDVAARGLGVGTFLAGGEGIYSPDVSAFATQAKATEWLQSTLAKYVSDPLLAA